MSATDRARQALERNLPDLHELVKHELFTESEVGTIVKRRNEFEHILNGNNTTPEDYMRYAAFEMNFKQLQQHRRRKLRYKGPTLRSTDSTILTIFDRAVARYPTDVTLWLQYIRYCEQLDARKKINRVFTSALRRNPREWSLWVVAAKHYNEERGDIAQARGYLQRGLRFCSDERQLYLQYAKLEISYLAKLAARRRLLASAVQQKQEKGEEGGWNDDKIMLPTAEVQEPDVSAEDAAGVEHFDAATFTRLGETPLLQGALPKVIFDSAMKQFHNPASLAEAFFDLTTDVVQDEAIQNVQQHIIQYLETSSPQSAELVICRAKQALAGIPATTADFPAALGRALAILREAQLLDHEHIRLSERIVLTLAPYTEVPQLDQALATVLTSVIRKHVRALESSGTLTKLLKRLMRQDEVATVRTIKSVASNAGS